MTAPASRPPSRDVGAERTSRIALAVALTLSLAACQTGPSPATPPGSRGPGTASPGSAAPSGAIGSPATEPALAAALRDAIDMPDILADLERLQVIANEHGGVRPAGSPGHDASVEFVAAELRTAGYVVELQPVELPAFEQRSPSVVQVVGGAASFEDVRDFKAMLFSGSGDVTGPLYDLGFDPRFEPDQPRGLGCDPDDWTEVPTGVVVLAYPGPCRRLEVVLAAQEAGAVAIVTAYPGWIRDAVLRPTLVDPSEVRIPVIGATEAMGAALAQAAADGASVRVATDTLVETRTSINLIAETPGGDASQVLMLGGHLDSVVDGPGINDNGTGTMTVLEIAREVAALATANPGAAPAWKVRVAFWTGEEIGLLGSFAYARALAPDAIGAIRAYLNFDMLGSSNGIRTVYDGLQTSNPGASGIVSGLFSQALETRGLGWQPEAVGAVSDHFPLDQLGIAVGGLFSGANEHKSAAQVVLFGGTAGVPNDPCYHLECDTVDNVDAAWLEQLARAAAWVTGALISGEVDLAQ